MHNDEIVLTGLTAFIWGLLAYVAYLSWRIKKLDKRIELREQAIESARHTGSPSPAE